MSVLTPGVPVHGILPQTLYPIQFAISGPFNCETVVEFLSHDVVVQAIILNPGMMLTVPAPPSANMMRWRQVDQMNAHVRRAAAEILRGEHG